MKYKNFLLPAVMAASSIAIAADSTDDRISKLENEISILKSQNDTSQANAIRFNGFFSVGATTAVNSLGYVESNHTYDFEELTKLGLQASFDIDDSTSITTQLLAKGNDEFKAQMEWAYISHTLENDSTIRAGKLRIPYYMYSDFLDVGLAQPWARPPEEVYSAPFNSMLGVDYTYDIDLDDSILGFQTFVGQGEASIAKVDTILGLVVTWSNDNLTLRGTYSDLSITGKEAPFDTLLPSGSKGEFTGLGASYDNGQLLIIAEVNEVIIEGAAADTRSSYVTLGYRMDNWLPYVTIAATESLDDDKRGTDPGNQNRQRDVYSLGAKQDLASNMSIKYDVTYLTDFGDTVGVIGKNATRTYDDSIVYSVRLDTVF